MDKAPQITQEGLPRTALLGCAVMLGLGFVIGVLRYWFGFFVLIQGAVTAGLGVWGIIIMAGRSGKGPPHPGPGKAFRCALLWTSIFLLAELAGLGVAQPWFEPGTWVVRVVQGLTVEPVFGLSATGPVHRAFAGGASGLFWVILNFIDISIMLFFLMALPWSIAKREKIKAVSS